MLINNQVRRPRRNMARFVVVSILALAPLACGSKEAEDKPPEVEVLPAATNGSPVAVEFTEFTGTGERGMKVLAYNAGDKTAAAYFLLFRYYDASDKLLKVKPGTPFESDFGFTSMSGKTSAQRAFQVWRTLPSMSMRMASDAWPELYRFSPADARARS